MQRRDDRYRAHDAERLLTRCQQAPSKRGSDSVMKTLKKLASERYRDAMVPAVDDIGGASNSRLGMAASEDTRSVAFQGARMLAISATAP